MIYLFILLVLFIILIFSTKIKNDDTFLNKTTTNVFKAIAAIFIVLHHISQYIVLDITFLNFIFSKIGYLCTAIFLFLSGYGNYLSYRKIENENLKIKIFWLLKRLLKIIFDYLIIFAVSLVCIYAFGEKIVVENIFSSLIKLALPGWVNWYIKIQLMLYILFAIVYIPKRISNKKRDLIMLVLILFYILVMKLNNFGQYWFNTVLCFNFGIILAEYKNYIKLKNNIKLSLLVSSIILFAIFMSFSLFIEKIKIISALLFCLTFVIGTFYIKINSKILQYISKYSLEIYLSHLIILSYIKDINYNSNLKVLVIFGFTFIISIITNKFSDLLLSKIKLDNNKLKARG